MRHFFRLTERERERHGEIAAVLCVAVGPIWRPHCQALYWPSSFCLIPSGLLCWKARRTMEACPASVAPAIKKASGWTCFKMWNTLTKLSHVKRIGTSLGPTFCQSFKTIPSWLTVTYEILQNGSMHNTLTENVHLESADSLQDAVQILLVFTKIWFSL